MSWWIRLVNPEQLNEWNEPSVAQCAAHTEGATYALGGSTEAELNMTYNYSPWFYKHLHQEGGLRWMNNKQASKTIDRLRYAIGMLGTERDDDYWKPTPGNAGYALSILLRWAEQFPTYVWEIH